MKLAVITWFHYRNYGTALQVYALSHYLKSLGHDVEVIRYYPQEMGRVLPDYSIYNTVRNVMRHRIAKLMPLRRPRQRSISHAVHSRFFINDEKESLFDAFLNNTIKFTGACTNLSDLESLNNQYDAFICGSDQIWAPNVFDPHYFLDFVIDTNKLISYAPSIGLTKIKDKYVYGQMRDLIKRIKYLSVREESGAQLIKDMTDRDASIVVDPTLLIPTDFWRQICRENNNHGAYLIVYMLGREEAHWKEIYYIAKKKKLEVKVIPVYEQDLDREGCITNSIGPVEFLSLFENAKYVCTDSFHGTVFSLLFHKAFSVFERFSKDDEINQNSRIYNLLKKTGTFNRLIRNSAHYIDCPEIDYSIVDSLLNQWIINSKLFLDDSLDGATHKQLLNTTNHVLSNHSLCCGCGACAHVCPQKAITIGINESGFYHAIINDSICINCGKCKTVCQYETHIFSTYMSSGCYYSYKDKDTSVLLSSSSGGAAYRIALSLMSTGYSIAGCTFDVQLQRAKHILIEKKDELYKLQGSKYMQSAFSQVLPLISDSSKPVAIFGTPCQIAAAKKIFSERKDFVYVDLICHGVPTYNLLVKYKEYLSEQYGSNPSRVNICNRYKPKGWRVIHTFTSDGDIETCFSQKEDLYFRVFESMNCYSRACYDCMWRDKTSADLRIGDFWGPIFEKDTTGVSIIGCMTERGERVLNAIRQENKGILEPQTSENYFCYQQTKNYAKPLFYDEVMRRFSDQKTKLPFIVEKYVEPFEQQVIRRDKKERRKHTLRLLLDEYNLL